ncbi:MAG: AMP-binding protein, partial [Pirellulaceae bacterium]|nr:AMP-binding protein [Pirellulaceae bacterium]
PRVQPTLANAVPSLANRLLDADRDSVGLGRLRLLGCGGAAISAEDFAGWHRRGVTVIQGYGLTEASPVICSATPDNATAGWVGEFVDGWEYQIRDGRLFVRGPHVMVGYWDDPVATNERVDASGWLDTGDLVQRDPATEQIRILGRADDVIVLDSGDKVHPQAIEREIERIEGVRHAMLVGVGRMIQAWIDGQWSGDIRELRTEIAARLADRPPWEIPTEVHLFDPSLDQRAGELTSKGSLRRHVITKNRL